MKTANDLYEEYQYQIGIHDLSHTHSWDYQWKIYEEFKSRLRVYDLKALLEKIIDNRRDCLVLVKQKIVAYKSQLLDLDDDDKFLDLQKEKPFEYNELKKEALKELNYWQLSSEHDLNELEFYERQLTILNRDYGLGVDDEILEEAQERTVWLYELGVLKFLEEKHNVNSTGTISRIICKGMGCTSESVRKALERIKEPNSTLLEKNNGYINSEFKRLKIDRMS